jgi:ankyrin repeat protein
VEIARFLLEHGVDTEARDNRDYGPLERVAHGGLHDVELVQVLLEHGADADAQDNERCTPLYWASDWGEPVVVRVLPSHGADATAQCKNKQTALHRAKEEEVARLLLQHGADANAMDIMNRRPLYRESELGRVGAARVLLEYGVDANARANNATPLHLASGSKHRVVSTLYGCCSSTAPIFIHGMTRVRLHL